MEIKSKTPIISCSICGSTLLLSKKYNRDYVSSGLKSRLNHIIVKLLPYINFLVPKSFTKLKKISARKVNKFKGYVNVCSNCGYGFMNNPPSEKELKEYYLGEYWFDRSKEQKMISLSKEEYKKDPRAIYQINFSLDRINKKGLRKSLEIGAGAALASLLLRDKCGSNLILDVCEAGSVWKEYYKENQINSVADYFPFNTNEKYDYIHTSHWLEHVLDLDDTILKLKDICKVGGHVFVEVPNTGHEYWDLPLRDTPHIHFLTVESLKKLFENNNFTCLNIKECGISYIDRLNGVALTPDKYGENKKGFFIRAIFRRN